MAVVDLGGGRQRKEDRIDPSVGLRWLPRVGDRLERGGPVAEILAAPGTDVAPVARRIEAALSWSEAPVPRPDLFLGRLGS